MTSRRPYRGPILTHKEDNRDWSVPEHTCDGPGTCGTQFGLRMNPDFVWIDLMDVCVYDDILRSATRNVWSLKVTGGEEPVQRYGVAFYGDHISPLVCIDGTLTAQRYIDNILQPAAA